MLLIGDTKSVDKFKLSASAPGWRCGFTNTSPLSAHTLRPSGLLAEGSSPQQRKAPCKPSMPPPPALHFCDD
jgi:hypothetical protein